MHSRGAVAILAVLLLLVPLQLPPAQANHSSGEQGNFSLPAGGILSVGHELVGGAFWIDVSCEMGSDCVNLELSFSDAAGSVWNDSGRFHLSIRGIAAEGVAYLNLSRTDSESHTVSLWTQSVLPREQAGEWLTGEGLIDDLPDQLPAAEDNLSEWRSMAAQGCQTHIHCGAHLPGMVDSLAVRWTGALSDVNDTDVLRLPDLINAVHSIRMSKRSEPMRLEAWSAGEAQLLLLREDLNATTGHDVEAPFLLSTQPENPIYLLVSALGGNVLAPYEISVSTHADQPDEAGSSLELPGGSEGNPSSDPPAGVMGGHLHSSDSGDEVSFTVGGGGQMHVRWQSLGDVDFTMTQTARFATGDVDEDVPMSGGNSEMTFRTMSADSCHMVVELTVNVTATGEGQWWVYVDPLEGVDEGCRQDRPNQPYLDVDSPHQPRGTASFLGENQLMFFGHLSGSDTRDVYPVTIVGESWEVHRLIASVNTEGVEVQVQRWEDDNGTLYPKEVITGTDTAGVEVSPGHHFVVVELAGATSATYSIGMQALNVTPEENVPTDPNDWQDMSHLFTNFYIIIALVLLAPLAWVLWNRKKIESDRDIQGHERWRLQRLKERLADLLSTQDIDESLVIDALAMLADVQWAAIEAEMGEALLSHHTEAITLKAWKMGADSIVVGIHVSEEPWKLAALRFEAAQGPEWKIAEVSPSKLFDGDEIFLGTLKRGSTTFLHLRLEGDAQALDLHLSGLVDDVPLAAIPARALLMHDEEE
jgi:hypothetical protein